MPRAAGPAPVDVVFRAEGRRPRWVPAVIAVAGLYGGSALLLQLAARPSLTTWGAALAHAVHEQLAREQETVVEPPPPPPEAPAPAAPATSAVAARHAGPRSRSLPSAAPAASARALVAAASAPVDLTAAPLVTGAAAQYAGGVTRANAATTVAAAPSPSAGGYGTPVSLADDDWRCAWPAEAEAAERDEETVVLRVHVRPDGRVSEVRVLADPGFGFGAAARACAQQTLFQPARAPSGAPVGAWSPAIRVRFVR